MTPSRPPSIPPARLRRGMAVASLTLGVVSVPLFGLLGIGPLAGIGLGILALVMVHRRPQEFGGKVLAIAGILISTGALILFLMLPGLVRTVGRPQVEQNERNTIGDVRAVVAGEVAYRSPNGGFYDTLECLAAPTRCIPKYQGPTFLDPALASLETNHGYERSFHAGPPAARLPKASSPSSLQSFVYVAVPISGMTGTRAFCGDSSGRVCSTPDGSPPQVVDGQCAPSCTSLNY